MSHETLSLRHVAIFGISINNISQNETIREIDKLIKKGQPSYVVTPNVHHISVLQKDKKFREIYSQADLVLPDSRPLMWAARILGQPIRERVAGSDLLPLLCRTAAQTKHRLFFLGSAPGVAKKAAEILTQKYPGLNIAGTYSPSFGFENNTKENRKIVAFVKQCRPDILFVGVGAPKQEKWIWEHKDELSVPVSIAIGASFDFIVGTVKRAPKWMQEAGLEWFFRLCHEPGRLWKRYFFGNLLFIWLVFKEMMK